MPTASSPSFGVASTNPIAIGSPQDASVRCAELMAGHLNTTSETAHPPSPRARRRPSRAVAAATAATEEFTTCLLSRPWRRARPRRRVNPYLRESEFPDLGAPNTARHCVILVSMPEGCAIGINFGHAVIDPAPTRRSLGAGASDHQSFALRQVIWRIGGKT